jgi:hypothetical protein
VLSDYDRDNVGKILAGEGSWFSAQLLRLVMKADLQNRERLRHVFPEHVELYEQHVGWSDRSDRHPVRPPVELARTMTKTEDGTEYDAVPGTVAAMKASAKEMLMSAQGGLIDVGERLSREVPIVEVLAELEQTQDVVTKAYRRLQRAWLLENGVSAAPLE